MFKKEFINPNGLPRPKGYMHIVKIIGSGTLVLVSGQVAEDKDGEIVGVGEIETQIRQVFNNLSLALEAAGATFKDVVCLHTYLVDISDYGTFCRVRSEYLDLQKPPASTLVQVKSLAKSEYLVEIEAMAVVSQKG